MNRDPHSAANATASAILREPALDLTSTRLALMMFLQYAVWGAWLPIVGTYLSQHLGFTPGEITWVVGTAGAVGALLAPFIAGQIADRFFSAERFLAIAMIAGGVVIFVLADRRTYAEWLWLSVLYSVIYMPTIPLSNSLAFAHLRHPEVQFPPVRMWGTIGWIAVSWVFPMVWLQTGLKPQWMPPFLVGSEVPDVLPRLADAFRLSGILSVLYGLYCFTLPHTPPHKSGQKIAFVKAFRLLGRPGLAVLTLAALPIAIIHTLYFVNTSAFLTSLPGVRAADVQPAMSIGQFSEIFVLAGLGLLLRSLGFRTVLALGCAAYVLRFAIFALGAPTWLVVGSQALHGVCFACFYAAAFIYVERVSPADVRHSAQTVFGIVILGIGPLLAGPVGDAIGDFATRQVRIEDCLARNTLIPQTPKAADAAAPELAWDQLYAGATADMQDYRSAHPADQSRAWRGLRPDTAVSAIDYTRMWICIAALGAISMLLLAALFRTDPVPAD